MQPLNFSDDVPRVVGKVDIFIRRGGKWKPRNAFNPLTGQIEKILFPAGAIEGVSAGHNLTVNRLKVQQSHLVVGHETTTRFANRMVFGTGGHIAGDSSTPISPDVSDSGLEAQVLSKTFTTYEFPSQYSVRIIAFIVETEANGFTISESGLLAADNSLIARRTFPGLPKTSDFVFEFRHTLVF